MAVYTNVSLNDVSSFIADYDVGEVVSFTGIAEGTENSNYSVFTSKGKFILTLYEKRVDPSELPFFLGLMNHFAHKGIDCATPIKDRKGFALKELCGRPAALISFLEGLSIKNPNIENCRDLGRALAEMHLAGSDFKMSRKNDFSLSGWKKLAVACEGRADECAPGLSRVIHDEIKFLSKNWPTKLPNGIIHADLFPDNVFFLDGRLSGLIDYYFACTDMLVYDVSICLNAWCFDVDGSFDVLKARSIIKEYNKVRALSIDEKQALPILCRGAALRFMLTRLYDWLNRVEGAIVETKNPNEFLKMLEFHQQISSTDEYIMDVTR
jgi:homoserine kinase type II